MRPRLKRTGVNSNKPRVGVLLSRVRVEEKLLLAELESRGVETKVIDDRGLVLAVEHKPELGVDVILERCIQHGTALYALSVLDAWGVPTVNRYEVAEICGNKLLTTMRLIRDGVPSPRTRVAFTPESALAAIEELGYPVVLKPLIGSWGRLVSKVNDREAAEAELLLNLGSVTVPDRPERPHDPGTLRVVAVLAGLASTLARTHLALDNDGPCAVDDAGAEQRVEREDRRGRVAARAGDPLRGPDLGSVELGNPIGPTIEHRRPRVGRVIPAVVVRRIAEAVVAR